jgi:hypothetical protein
MIFIATRIPGRRFNTCAIRLEATNGDTMIIRGRSREAVERKAAGFLNAAARAPWRIVGAITVDSRTR